MSWISELAVYLTAQGHTQLQCVKHLPYPTQQVVAIKSLFDQWSFVWNGTTPTHYKCVSLNVCILKVSREFNYRLIRL